MRSDTVSCWLCLR